MAGALHDMARGKMDALQNLQAAAAQRLGALSEPAARAAAADQACRATYAALVTAGMAWRMTLAISLDAV